MLGQLMPEVGDISGHIRGQEPGLGWEAFWVVGFLLTHICSKWGSASTLTSAPLLSQGWPRLPRHHTTFFSLWKNAQALPSAWGVLSASFPLSTFKSKLGNYLLGEDQSPSLV